MKLLKYSEYLENGLFISGKRSAVRWKDKQIINILGLKIPTIIFNPNKNKKYFATEIYFRNDGSIRFFDKKKNKVLIVFKNKENFKNYIKIYNETIFDFKQPKILKIDNNSLSITEELIYNTLLKTSKELYIHILRVLKKAYANQKLGLKITDYKIDYSLEKDFLESYLEHNINIDNISLKKVFTHGDMCIKNVIQQNTHTYIIDWEHYGEYSFIYDIFNPIYVKILDDKDYTLFEEFIKGTFDQNIKEIFKIFKINYNNNNKFIYLYLYILERLGVKGDLRRKESGANNYGLILADLEKNRRKYEDNSDIRNGWDW